VTGGRDGLSRPKSRQDQRLPRGGQGGVCAPGPAHRPAGPKFHKECLFVVRQWADEISGLISRLNLSHNGLTSLPPEVGRLTNLTELDLRGNRMLKDPPPDVVDRGTRAILEYLRAKLASAPNTQESKSGDKEQAREP
jgi:hypothetical protein